MEEVVFPLVLCRGRKARPFIRLFRMFRHTKIRSFDFTPLSDYLRLRKFNVIFPPVAIRVPANVGVRMVCAVYSAKSGE